METVRAEVALRGRVQGVGLRPWLARAAAELGLAGDVRNTPAGVSLTLEGTEASIAGLLHRLREAPPAGARIDGTTERRLAAHGERGFRIGTSGDGGGARPALLPLDEPICEACLEDLFTPASRRHRYAFTHCARCGPRAAIIEALPFDRERTTLRGFPPCAACRAEHADPGDRRFHAQTIACPACGPALRAQLPGGARLEGDPVEHAAACLGEGGIVALKGSGGFHLVVDATRSDPVARLRRRKHRPGKPFAVLVPDAAAARRVASLGSEDERWLTGPIRAVVVAPRRPGGDEIVVEVAPRSRDLGVILPYAPVHWLLLFAPGTRPGAHPPRFPALVFTSANRSGEPTLHRDAEADAVLRGLADLIVSHDRWVARPNDDPVVRSAPGGPIPLRLSRGTAPDVLMLPDSAALGPDGLALGGDLKCAPAVAVEGELWLGEHVGDLALVATADALEERTAALCRLAGAKPAWVAHDLHPDYVGTGLAREIATGLGARPIAVQHHHAHAAAVLVEHGLPGPALAWVLDGAGFGPDGTQWGGELLHVSLTRFERLAHLDPVPLPGGDAAAREPWRMALAWLQRVFPEGAPDLPWHRRRGAESRALDRALAAGVAAPLTSSCGRLFDAVGSLLDLGDVADHEGEVAGALEGLAAGAEAHDLGLRDRAGFTLTDVVRALVIARARGVPRAPLARAFHDCLARRLAVAARNAAHGRDLGVVVLAGGCFVNRLLLGEVTRLLEADGLRVLRPRRLPVGDGGLAAGQAAVARVRARGPDTLGRRGAVPVGP